MNVPVEQIARRVGQTLRDSGPMSLSTLARKVDGVSPSLVLVTVGWLLHTKRLVLSGNSRVTQVMLAAPLDPVESQSAPVPASIPHSESGSSGPCLQ